MKGFRWAGDLNGNKSPVIKNSYVPDGTAIEIGEPVDFTPGTGIVVLAGPTDLDDPIYGVSMLEKVASDGVTSLPVSVSPTAIYKWSCYNRTYTATGGSTTTVTESSLYPQTNDFWIGGKIKIITCAADSSLNGKIVTITDSVGASGILTIGETLSAAIASGDTFQLCPGNRAHNSIGRDLDATAMLLDWDNVGGNVIELYDTNPDTFDVFVIFRKYAVVS